MVSVSCDCVLSKAWLQSFVEDALQKDDVFCLDSLSGVVFHGPGAAKNWLEPEAQRLLKSWGNTWLRYVDAADGTKPLLPGPYVLANGSMLQAWRVLPISQTPSALLLSCYQMEGNYFMCFIRVEK